MKTRSKTRREQGSALLIVLGFLSFMMISAVSFAVYMRIERQASSNYRHAVTARHLLNSALYRAIDEIDSELRLITNGIPCSVKFPDWPGRTRPSAVPNGADNGEEAHVLSLEALSYVPGILVNEVRRYAVMNNVADHPNGVPAEGASYLGAKWRPLSLPVSSMAGGENAYEEAVVGRYAYLCVNVSDMLNVNEASASAHKVNQVYVGHLFSGDAERSSFDSAKTNDVNYATSQDLYDCLEARGIASLGNPYQDWLNGSEDTFLNATVTKNHVLVTEGRVITEPTNACSDVTYSPFNLNSTTPAQINAAFVKNLDAALPLVTLTSAERPYVIAMLQDYVDVDSKPTFLNAPCVERVPMITQVTFSLTPAKAAEIISRAEPSPTDPNRTMYVIRVGDPTESYGDLVVEAVWPFKNYQAKTPLPDPNSFKVQAQVYLKIASLEGNRNHLTTEFPLNNPNNLNDEFYYKIGASTENLTFPNLGSPDDQGDKVNNFFSTVTLKLDPFGRDVDLLYSDGTPPATPFCNINSFVGVALIVFLQIVDKDGNVVDQAPKAEDGLAADVSGEFDSTPKIFFETDKRQVVAPMASGTLSYQWTALETPDPRLNHKAANWVKWTSNSSRGEGADSQKPIINKSTTDLLGAQGRDSDIFMNVADSGFFQSPGELGFIARPFVFNTIGNPHDFSAAAEDVEHMFRTIRTYDHTAAYPKDKVYEYFYAANADGSLSGARVNPLSDIDKVLESAIGGTPFDFGLAGQTASATTYDSPASPYKGEWQDFIKAWSGRFKVARSYPISTPAGNLTIKQSWMVHLRDVYGLENTFGWYANGDTMKIFGLDLTMPLHEIDRKMLMAYSLDSFSDRQQLFLYILRAEAIAPSGNKTRSLAGGQAVALVWRDPYPAGYRINATVDGTGEITTKQEAYTHGTWYSNLRRLSPWFQVNNNEYNGDPYDAPSSADPSISGRKDGFHKSQILFFKQLDN